MWQPPLVFVVYAHSFYLAEVSVLSYFKVVAICGDLCLIGQNAFFLGVNTACGSLYTWGRGLFGRLGVGVSQDEHVPSIVEIGACGDEDDDSQSSYSDVSNRDDGRSGPLLRDRDGGGGAAQRLKIVQVAAGSYHSLALAGAI